MIEILLITNKGDITTDFIVKRLKNSATPFYRLNTEDIGEELQVSLDFSANKFLIIDKRNDLVIDFLKIKSVYFRRPETKVEAGSLTDGQVNFLSGELLYTLEGIYRILDNAYWISNVYAIRNAENKIYQLRLAKTLGFTIPESIITNEPDHADRFYRNNNKSCIIKPIKSGMVAGVNEEGIIFTSKVEINSANKERIIGYPVYLQELVPKKGDVRVTMVGKKIFAAFIHSQERQEAEIDWRKTDAMLSYSKIKLPREIARACRSLTKLLSLNFAAIDFVLDPNGNYIFLEINPNGQWAWIEKQLNYKISNEICALLVKNCAKRNPRVFLAAY